MYRCEICCNVSPSGQHLLRHTIYRRVPPRTVASKVRDPYGNMRTGYREEPERTEIAKEIALCQTCYTQVHSGTPLSTVIRERKVDYREYPNPTPEKNNRIREYTEDEVDNLLDATHESKGDTRKHPISHVVVEEQPPTVRKGNPKSPNSLYGTPRPSNRKN